jgi:hypothetical protein
MSSPWEPVGDCKIQDDAEDEQRTPGLDCYCHKQMSLWDSLAHEAETKFTNILGRPLYS